MADSNNLQVENPMSAVVEQNIQINAVGGNSFSPGDRINIHIPASTGFINPAESYLQFNVIHSGKCMTMCNAMAGAHGYIDQLFIKSLNTGESLESIDSYNFLVSNLLWRNRHLKDHRNLQDLALGCEDADFSPNAYKLQNPQPFYDVDSTAGTHTAQKVKMNLNLLSGVLGNLGRNTMCPVIALGGLNIQLNLASVLQSSFPMASEIRDTAANPTRTAGDLQWADLLQADDYTNTTGGQVTFSEFDFSSFANDGNLDGLAHFPLVADQVIELHYKIDGVGATKETSVVTVTNVNDKVQLKVNHGIVLENLEALTEINIKGHYSGNSAPNWTISDVKMVLQVIAPSKQQMQVFNKGISEGKGKSWRYYSVTNYKSVVNSSQRQASIRIPTINTKSLALLSVPQHLDTIDTNRTYGYMENGEDGESEYQYLLKTRLTPDRRVPCARNDIEVKDGKYKLWQREVEKCLNVGGVSVERLDSNALGNYNESTPSPFCIGRAVGSLRATSMLANTEPTLNINYSSKSKDQLYHNFVFHTREANFSKSGLVVTY